MRLTAQINEKNKFSAYYAWMPRQRPYINTSSGLNLAVSYAPSGTMWAPTFSPYVGQLKWTSTVSSRLLAEAGYSINHYSFGTLNQPFIPAGAVTKEDTVLATQWNAGDGDMRFAYVSQVADRETVIHHGQPCAEGRPAVPDRLDPDQQPVSGRPGSGVRERGAVPGAGVQFADRLDPQRLESPRSGCSFKTPGRSAG